MGTRDVMGREIFMLPGPSAGPAPSRRLREGEEVR